MSFLLIEGPLKLLLLYNNNNIIINKTRRLCRFWYKRVYFFLSLVLGDTRKETQFIKAYANHTMLIPSFAVHLMDSKILTHLRRLWSKLIWSHQIRKNSTATSNGRTATKPSFSKSSNSQAISSGRDVIHSSIYPKCPSGPISCLAVCHDRWWLSYPFRAGMR